MIQMARYAFCRRKGGGRFHGWMSGKFAPGAGVACPHLSPVDAGRVRCIGTGSSAERAGGFRFLCTVAVLVAVLLRGGARTRQQRAWHPGAMRRPSLFLRGAWAVAAICARLSRIL